VSGAVQGYRVLGLELGLEEPESVLRERALAAAGVGPEALRGFRIARKALDARRRGSGRNLRFVVHAEIEIDAGPPPPGLERALRAGRVVPAPQRGSIEVPRVHPSARSAQVAVVGAGPAGLFGALVLARNGARVTLIERGPGLRERGRAVAAFGNRREPDPEANLLFGEGGAGTYSDGKLYTRVEHPLEIPLLDELVACGAPPEIRYDARAHVGTDRLHRILPALRTRLEAAGVKLVFGTRMEGLVADTNAPRRICALATSAGELACDAVLLAPGHSARDTWRMLEQAGVALESKPFQLGVRIEHPQDLVDAGRYGPQAGELAPAYYALSSRSEAGIAAAHSFCMCPGGQIVASVSQAGLLCTNGMSNSRHSSGWANAALVVTLGPRELGEDRWAGVSFQESLERAAFLAGGGDYTAPAQHAPDFLAGRESRSLGETSYRFGVCPGRLDELLPAEVRDALRGALLRFDREIPGFASQAGLLVGVETRSSGPVRLPRDETSRRARGFANLFPVGEGSGHAGGIMSAAIDGARSAQALLEQGIG
jgi:uncharacterized FAD-dependent dehydrogenase